MVFPMLLTLAQLFMTCSATIDSMPIRVTRGKGSSSLTTGCRQQRRTENSRQFDQLVEFEINDYFTSK